MFRFCTQNEDIKIAKVSHIWSKFKVLKKCYNICCLIIKFDKDCFIRRTYCCDAILTIILIKTYSQWDKNMSNQNFSKLYLSFSNLVLFKILNKFIYFMKMTLQKSRYPITKKINQQKYLLKKWYVFFLSL